MAKRNHCWLQVHHADLVAAQAREATMPQCEYLQRRQDRAHRRYLSALKALSTFRRLALPIQVDVKVAGTVETRPAPQPAEPHPRWSPAVMRN